MNSFEFQNHLNETIAEYSYLGATACLMENGNVYTCSAGFIDDKKEIPYSDETLVRVGCLTKVFIAAQIMILEDEKLLSVESLLIDHIPELKSEKYGLSGVTIKRLLNHNSGLVVGLWSSDKTLVDASNVVDTLGELTAQDIFVQSPGKNSSYSSLGYVLLAAIIERIRGCSWIVDLDSKIFRPLGIKCWQLAEIESSKKFATEGKCLQSGFNKELLIPKIPQQIQSAIGGALALTATDLITFLSMFIGSNKQHHLLSDRSIQLMQDEIIVPSGPWPGLKGLAFGFLAYNDGSYGFTGNGINNHVLIRFCPSSKTGLSVVANYHSATLLFETLWKVIYKKNEACIRNVIERKVDEPNALKIEGVYSDGMLRFEVIKSNEKDFKIKYTNLCDKDEHFKVEADMIMLESNHFVVPELGNFAHLWVINTPDEASSFLWNGVTLFRKNSFLQSH